MRFDYATHGIAHDVQLELKAGVWRVLSDGQEVAQKKHNKSNPLTPATLVIPFVVNADDLGLLESSLTATWSIVALKWMYTLEVNGVNIRASWDKHAEDPIAVVMQCLCCAKLKDMLLPLNGPVEVFANQTSTPLTSPREASPPPHSATEIQHNITEAPVQNEMLLPLNGPVEVCANQTSTPLTSPREASPPPHSATEIQHNITEAPVQNEMFEAAPESGDRNVEICQDEVNLDVAIAQRDAFDMDAAIEECDFHTALQGQDVEEYDKTACDIDAGDRNVEICQDEVNLDVAIAQRDAFDMDAAIEECDFHTALQGQDVEEYDKTACDIDAGEEDDAMRDIILDRLDVLRQNTQEDGEEGFDLDALIQVVYDDPNEDYTAAI